MSAASPYAASRLMGKARWFAIAKGCSAAVSLLLQFVLVRHLAVEDYAAYTLFVAGAGVLALVTMFGTDRVVYRFIPPLRVALRWREMLAVMGGLLGARLALMLVLLGALYAGAAVLLPANIVRQLEGIAWESGLYALALAVTDSLLVFCNSVGAQRTQVSLFMLAAVVRLLAVGVVLLERSIDAQAVAAAFAWTEVALAVALAAVLAMEIARVRARGQPHGWQPGFRLAELVRDSLGTQAAYLLALPFKGALLKLMVGAVSPPVVTASFGFFQTLADRAYQLMPVFLLKGILEPTLAHDYAARHSMARVRLAVSLLLRFNFLLIFLGVAILLGSGEQLIGWVTHGRYTEHVTLAVLIALQLTGLSVGESLFFALNPVGRIGHHNRLWMLFSLPFFALLAMAAWLHSTVLLVLAATVPHYVVYAWLRYVTCEPVLADGLGIGTGVMLRFAIATGAAALAARAVLLLSPGLAATLAATLGAAIVFFAVLRMTGLFHAAEVESVRSLSPRLAQLLHPFAVA